MILFSSSTGLYCFLLMFLCGLLAGVLYEIGFFIRKTIPIYAVSFVVDFVFVLVSTLIFIVGINFCNWGEFRVFLLFAMFLGLFVERISLGFLVAKVLEFIYNKIVIKISTKLKKLRGKQCGRKKTKNNC